MPKTVGDYKLLKTLGEGAFSKVKEAVNVKTGDRFAVKVIDRQLITENNMDRQLRREIKIMGTMDHPGLVKLHAVMHSSKNIFLVLDLAEGGELFTMLAEGGPLPEAKARNYFQQLIDALDYMHKQGAVHRDLKPENLLLDKNGKLKIADFGLSIMASANETVFTRCGTPNYVAPEIFCQDGYIGPPADVWSAGVILYVMLAAALPFEAENLTDLARQIMSVQIEYPPEFSPESIAFLKKIIVADPNERYTIEQIKKDPWFKKDYHPIISSSVQSDRVDEEVSMTKDEPANETDDSTMNAFELIAKMSGVNVERLIDTTAHVTTSTSFSTTKKIEEISSALTAILNSLRAKKIQNNPEKHTFKATVPVSSNTVTIKISMSVITGNTWLVEVRRLSGSHFDFHRVYNTIKTKLG